MPAGTASGHFTALGYHAHWCPTTTSVLTGARHRLATANFLSLVKHFVPRPFPLPKPVYLLMPCSHRSPIRWLRDQAHPSIRRCGCVACYRVAWMLYMSTRKGQYQALGLEICGQVHPTPRPSNNTRSTENTRIGAICVSVSTPPNFRFDAPSFLTKNGILNIVQQLGPNTKNLDRAGLQT